VQCLVVDAFASEAFRGNPAGVCFLDSEVGDDWMRSVAAELKHAETAFVLSRYDGTYDLRWWTPEVEVPLCGHATLASAHVLYETAQLEQVTFQTRSGPLHATHDASGEITLDFPVAEPIPAAPMHPLFDAMGIEPIDFFGTTGDFFCCVVANAAIVRDLAPDFNALRQLRLVRGVYVTAAADDGYDIVSRCFAPRVGIDEDPVTGSMHCLLVAYWAPRLGRDELRAYQASARGGEMTVVRKGDRALITGRATTVLRGELTS
jgi:PhzF family phenazine biosynthesis protein